jgi:predicted  nucleic acid-binding Zn-ribbon protein
MSIQNQVLLETTATRDRAEALLRTLLDYKSQSEKNLAELRQPDAFKNVTGRSSLDNAIATTQRMIEALNRVISQARKEEPVGG